MKATSLLDASENNYHEIEVDIVRAPLRIISDVVYSQVESRGFENVPLHMDIIRPDSEEPLPAVVYITGGGYIKGTSINPYFVRRRGTEPV